MRVSEVIAAILIAPLYALCAVFYALGVLLGAAPSPWSIV